MHEEIVCQGRSLSATELVWLRDWVEGHRQWSRHRLALGLCHQWQWSSPAGRLKNYAARSFLLKLEEKGLIQLPPVRKEMRRRTWLSSFQQRFDFCPSPDPIVSSLIQLRPLSVFVSPRGSEEEARFRSYLTTHHYLRFGKTVGENLQYLVQDRQGRDLACLLFGSAAWKVEARDRFIGWDDGARTKHLSWITNNTRFLILPWVKVPHLASHILGIILRRLSYDWQKKYGHPIHLVETFVEKDRFRGTCYRAANWIYAGETKGRSRQDRDQTMIVPVKDVYLFPLHQRFREALC